MRSRRYRSAVLVPVEAGRRRAEASRWEGVKGFGARAGDWKWAGITKLDRCVGIEGCVYNRDHLFFFSQRDSTSSSLPRSGATPTPSPKAPSKPPIRRRELRYPFVQTKRAQVDRPVTAPCHHLYNNPKTSSRTPYRIVSSFSISIERTLQSSRVMSLCPDVLG